MFYTEAVVLGCSTKKLFLKIQSLAFNCVIKETRWQVFFCELFKIFKNTYFIEHPRRLRLFYIQVFY